MLKKNIVFLLVVICYEVVNAAECDHATDLLTYSNCLKQNICSSPTCLQNPPICSSYCSYGILPSECPTGTYREGDFCMASCSIGTVYRNGECQPQETAKCPHLYNYTNGICLNELARKTCNDANCTVSSKNISVCSNNAILYDGVCLPHSVALCPFGSALVNGTCVVTENVCPPNSFYSNGQCMQCPENSTLIQDGCYTCSDRMEFKDGLCVCPPDTALNSDNICVNKNDTNEDKDYLEHRSSEPIILKPIPLPLTMPRQPQLFPQNKLHIQQPVLQQQFPQSILNLIPPTFMNPQMPLASPFSQATSFSGQQPIQFSQQFSPIRPSPFSSPPNFMSLPYSFPQAPASFPALPQPITLPQPKSFPFFENLMSSSQPVNLPLSFPQESTDFLQFTPQQSLSLPPTYFQESVSLPQQPMPLSQPFLQQPMTFSQPLSNEFSSQQPLPQLSSLYQPIPLSQPMLQSPTSFPSTGSISQQSMFPSQFGFQQTMSSLQSSQEPMLPFQSTSQFSMPQMQQQFQGSMKFPSFGEWMTPKTFQSFPMASSSETMAFPSSISSPFSTFLSETPRLNSNWQSMPTASTQFSSFQPYDQSVTGFQESQIFQQTSWLPKLTQTTSLGKPCSSCG